MAAVSSLSRLNVIIKQIPTNSADAIKSLTQSMTSMQTNLGTVQQQTSNLNSGLVTIECETIENLERVEALDADIQKLNVSLRSVGTQKRKMLDSFFIKLAIKKFTENVTLEERLGIVKHFMRLQFGDVIVTLSVRHHGNLKDTATNTR